MVELPKGVLLDRLAGVPAATPSDDNRRMIHQVVSPVMVGRDEELSRLEDALLAANRGGSRFVALAGEAGIGKTRLCLKLQERAHKLGLTVMSGGCSEAELTLPYLPLLEALGNFLATEDPAAIGTELGAARHELAQLFPQLAAGRLDSPPGDPTQAKMRLFESIVVLLSIPAGRAGLLLVVEDIHWADTSSRELLDYISRRVRGLRVMVVVTYRDDELHRRHPLVPTLQGWRRSGLVVVIKLGELTGSDVGQMIAAILDADELSKDFRDLMHHHSEGNPFVLEEMLKEALDRGDIYRTGAGWERKSLEQVRVPDTVRDTILLRVQRLEPAVVHVLEAASVLGRVFDYQTLVATAAMDETAVQKALEVAVREQLAEEDRTLPGRYRFRHGLTQEAIYSEILVPRRQEMHSRAADALARGAGTDFEVAFHLLGANRYQEAVPACARGAEQAIRLCAFGDAVALYERLLEHVEDARRRAEILCKMGEALWLNGQSVKAERHLDEGIKTLEALGDGDATAHFLITRGRCRWEASKPDLAARDYERARAILEPQGPSYDLALVYLRIAGLCLFELDAPGCIEASERAVAIARDAGSVEAHAWALGFLALGQFDIGQLESALQTLSDAYGIAKEHGAWWIASNHAWNEVWVRTHAAVPGAREALGRLQALDFGAEYRTGGILLARSYVRKGEGDLAGAADDALEAVLMFDQLGLGKMGWRAKTAAAEVLVELGRVDEARRHLPEISTRSELQDIVYDSRARVRCAEAAGDTESAAQAVRTIVEGVERLAMYRFLIGLAVEVLVAQGDLETADVLVGAGRNASVPTGMAFVDQAAARIALARGNAGLARSLAQDAIESMSRVDCALDELRTRVLLARALLATGERDDAASQLQHVVARADGFRAALVSREARSAAEELGIPLDERGPSAAAEATRPEEIPTTGERLVTVMFADVRGYTAQSAREAPAEMADRIGTMQRWAKQEVERHHGMVDKFAGDAVMATFNVSGAAVDHCLHALEAALAVRDKAALMDLELGIGIAVGPAIVGALAPGANVSVLGDATNLAARLQAHARGGELLLSAEAFKRVGDRVRAQDLGVDREELSLKGFDGPVAAYRVQVPWRHHHREPAHGPST